MFDTTFILRRSITFEMKASQLRRLSFTCKIRKHCKNRYSQTQYIKCTGWLL